MSDNSKIEWTDLTWNFITGCTKISDGCLNCYIERTPPFRMQGRRFDKPGIGGATGVKLHSDRLHWPITKWRKPSLIFVNSLADIFHEDVPDQFIAEAFAVMAMAKQHTFQLLTKRHARMRNLLLGAKINGFQEAVSRALFARGFSGGIEWPLPNCWIGVSVENQQWADIRIPALLETPAAVRWLSVEPMLGPIDLTAVPGLQGQWGHGGTHHGVGTEECPRELHHHHDDRCRFPINWTVCGGESGPGARPMNPSWVRSLRDQCRETSTPFFFKQWGEWVPLDALVVKAGAEIRAYPEFIVKRVGKKAAGRELDGRTWDQYPQAVAHADS